MTVKEYAHRFGMSVSAVYYRIRKGIIQAFKRNRRWYIPPPMEEKPMDFSVDWRAVSHNAPSRNMPRVVPWVYGIIRDAKGPSPRIELSPKRQKNDDAPVQLVLAHPDQSAVDAMGWDDTLEITVDGHTVNVQKSMGPAHGWCDPEPWALVVELDADHPLVVHAAEAAKPAQEATDKAVTEFDRKAQEWGYRNFPHNDFMTEIRSIFFAEWNGRADYWPGDPLPDLQNVCEKARDRLRS